MNSRLPLGERGQALVQVVIALVALLLFAALAIDVGQWYMQRRHMQNAADAGALAGARELCEGRTNEQAMISANDYAATRNGAPQVTASVESNIVVVTTTIPVTSFFARLIGIVRTDVHAVAKAACGGATKGCGIFPLAFDLANWQPINCGQQFIVWDEYNADWEEGDLCAECNCASEPIIDTAIHSGNKQIAPGERAWLSLREAATPFPQSGDPNCDACGGGDTLRKCWIPNDWPGQVSIGQCVAGQTGVIQNAIDATGDYRTGDKVRILIWQGSCGLGDVPNGCNTGGTFYRIQDFGCIQIVQTFKNVTLGDLDTTDDYDCPKNVKLIVAKKLCNDPDCKTDCGGTSGSTPVPGGLRAVSLID